MRALVLGATGHIGSHVVRALLGRGDTVRAAYRSPRYAFLLDGLPVERVQLDLEDGARLAAAVEGCETAFVCAGYYPRWTERRGQAIQRGIAQIRRVFDVLRRSRLQRIVYTSSAATIAPVWRSLYSTVKIAMEHAVQRYIDEGLPIVIVNPSVCIGEYDAHPFSGKLLLAFAGKRWWLPVYLEWAFNVVYTGDVGVGHVLAAEHGVVGERYLLTGEQTTIGAFARCVAHEAQVAPPRWLIPYPLAMTVATLSEGLAALTRTEPLLPRQVIRHARLPQRLDGSKAHRELGLPHTSMDDAIRRAVSWFRHYRYL